ERCERERALHRSGNSSDEADRDSGAERPVDVRTPAVRRAGRRQPTRVSESRLDRCEGHRRGDACGRAAPARITDAKLPELIESPAVRDSAGIEPARVELA